MTWLKARWFVAALGLPAVLMGSLPAQAQVSVQIGVNFSTYPRLVRVPSYPVYYSPGAPANLFFYDGLYWLYLDDGWYTSSWYNGPWSSVDPFDVPLYVLRVPVRYYAVPPPYFRAWRADAPPHWGEHWGPGWDRRHPGWNRWDPRRAPPPAPLPVYQRPYAGDRYPSPDEQRRLQGRQYRYTPREPVARAHLAPPVQPPQSAQQPMKQLPERSMHAPAQEVRPPHVGREGAPPPREAWPRHREAPAQQQVPPPARPMPMPDERRTAPAPHIERPAPGRGNDEERRGPGPGPGPGPGAERGGHGRGHDDPPGGGHGRER